jgi:FAD:protein FMN transferase
MSDSPRSENSSNSSRRDFLFGRSSKREAPRFERSEPKKQSEMGAGQISEFKLGLTRQDAYWEQYTKKAMACDFEILFNLQQYPSSAATAGAAFQVVDELEDQMTVYRSQSEVSQINRLAAHVPVPLEPNLFALLQLAVDLHCSTNGAFDITSAKLTKLWQFDQRQGRLPNSADIKNALETIGSHLIELSSERRTIQFLKNGVEINLGGIGKGYAIDRAADVLQNHGIQSFAIHGGQSSVKALGSESANTTTKSTGWWIGISHPLTPNTRLGRIRLHNQALGTSGTGRQGFFHRGVRYGHILSPRTGWPANHFLSTTVIASSAAVADALATAFFVMSFEEVAQYCEQDRSVKAILISEPPVSPNQRSLAESAAEGEPTGNLLLQTFNFHDDELEVDEGN